MWLDWQRCTGLADEDRPARLTAWVLAAHRAGAAFGLRLPGVELLLAQGDAHRRACLGGSGAVALTATGAMPPSALRRAGGIALRDARDTLFLLGVIG